MRDDGFIPWDWDIDLSAWYGDWVEQPELQEKLKSAGFELIYLKKSRSLRIEPVSKYPGWRQVDVHLYKVKADQACTYFFEFDIYNRTQKWLFKAIMVIDRIQRKAIKEPPSLKIALKNNALVRETGWYQSSIFRKLAYKVCKALKHSVFLFRFQQYAKLRRVRTPVQFYKELVPRSILGGDYLVPANTETYLQFKYGKDWQVPVQEYDWRNDGSVVERKETELGFSS